MMGDAARAADMQLFHLLFDHLAEITRQVCWLLHRGLVGSKTEQHASIFSPSSVSLDHAM